MKKISDLFSLNSKLNHAYIIVGDPSEIVLELKKNLQQKFGEDFISSVNPDFTLKLESSWGIAESRELKNFNSRRSAKYPIKISIIAPEVISLEAQNSLLKTLEEPSVDTHFFIITKRLETYLPTIISRCEIVRFDVKIFPAELSQLAEDWLVADIADRFDINKKIIDQQENNPSYVSDWLNCLLDIYWNKNLNQSNKKKVAITEILIKAIFYASIRGNSLRLVLDNLAGVVSTD